jgi:hypothetical protein
MLTGGYGQGLADFFVLNYLVFARIFLSELNTLLVRDVLGKSGV